MFLRSLETGNLFKDISETNFLYYSWLILKKNKRILNDFSGLEEIPIKKSWFLNTSFLLRNNLYIYSKNNFLLTSRFYSKKKNLVGIKNQIVQMAIFLKVFPYFEEFYQMRLLHLKQCL